MPGAEAGPAAARAASEVEEADRELLARYPAAEIGRGLAAHEPVAYRDNGNRAIAADTLLARLTPLLPLLGITRVADISALSSYPYPVFQAIRPNLAHHRFAGQNTGAQGKGPTAAQARVSAIMEAIEAACAEPRQLGTLIRGSFDGLRRQHALIDPRAIQAYTAVAPIAGDEPLMWTPAWCPTIDATVLVPAECVFFPFLADDYATRKVLPSGSNGLASGSTVLEAVIHGLYEVIERDYVHRFDHGAATIERLHLSGALDLAEHVAHANDYAVRLYALATAAPPDLPLVVCVLADSTRACEYLGYGCASDVDVAISRAVSEAWQSAATAASGAREDIGTRHDAHRAQRRAALPEGATLHVDVLRARSAHRRFATLGEEYRFLIDWLATRGHRVVAVANLTRRGIDVPVVKVIVPGLGWSAAEMITPDMPQRWPTSVDVARVRHGLRPAREATRRP